MIETAPPTPSPDGPELDRELLEEAQRHLNGAHPNIALNAALHMFVHDWRQRRRRAFDELRRMSDEGAFDYSKIDELS